MSSRNVTYEYGWETVRDPRMFWLINYDLKVRLLYARLEPWGA